LPEYVVTVLVTAAVTYLLTPLVRRGAIRVGAMPAVRDRDVHAAPVPSLGGLAMYGGLAAGLLVADEMSPLHSVFAGSRLGVGLLLAGGVIVVVGCIDDRWELSPISKAAGQVAAGAIVVWSGAELSWLPAPGGGTLIPTSDETTALTILVVVATINAINFIDGLDGLAAGIVCIAAISMFVYYYRLTQVLHLPEQAGPTLVSAVLAGACLGFLPHNFYPARIFMGDTGSMLLGLLLAYVPILSITWLDPASLAGHAAYRGATANRFPEVLPLLLPAAILVIPYADLLLAVVRRTRAGRSPLAPDTKHLHHRLLAIGHSHRSSVLIMYLWATLFSGAVVWLSITRTRLVTLAVITLAAMLALLLMSMPRLRFWERRRAAGPRPAAVGAGAGAGAAGLAARSPAAGPAAPRTAAAGPAAAASDRAEAHGQPEERPAAVGQTAGNGQPADPRTAARPADPLAGMAPGRPARPR
jgi:UDP-GlcNAc:undecaprenyl-phosphate/decaprenyl-phosphate GlcNAc-1-phosphate transferase